MNKLICNQMVFATNKQPSGRVQEKRCSEKCCKIHGRNLYWSLLFNKYCRPCKFIKKETLTKMFPCELKEVLRTPFLKITSGGCYFTGKFATGTSFAYLIIPINEESQSQFFNSIKPCWDLFEAKTHLILFLSNIMKK